MRDKIQHFLGGAAVAVSVCLIGGTPSMAFAAAALVGIAKEIWDANGHGHVEALDALATAGGGLLVAVAAAIAISV